MKLTEGSFPGAGGLKLHYRYYHNSAAKNVIVMTHGHGEHIGRYEKFSRYLKEESFSLAMFDSRGHGSSEGREVYIDSFEEYIGDAAAYLDFLKSEFGVSQKVFLFGHSVGGLTSVYLARRFPERFNALILSAPCLGLELPHFLVHLNSWFNQWMPRFVYTNPVYPPHLTHNPEEVDAYKKDPLIKRKMSVRLLAEVLSYAKALEPVPSFEFPFPLFILASGLEKVVDLKKTQQFFDKVKAPEKDMVVFEDYYHEIFNEQEQEKVFEQLKVFLRRAIQK